MGIRTIRFGPRQRAALREPLLVAALFLAYKAGRLITIGHVEEATRNTAWLWRVERLLHLPNEASIQHALLSHDWLVYAANGIYAYVHFPATAICLIWLYLRHRERYLWTRRLLAYLTAAALAMHVFFPLAPPRLTPATGLVDTGALYGPGVYGPPATDTLSNQYAAMPSLHVGWAVVVAIAVIGATRHRLRWLWLAHPLITLPVVVATGNHYWLDAVVAVLMLAVIAVLLPVPNPDRTAPAILSTTGTHRPGHIAQRHGRTGVVVARHPERHERRVTRQREPTGAEPRPRR